MANIDINSPGGLDSSQFRIQNGGTSSTGIFAQILRPRRSQFYSVKSNLLCRSRLLLCQSKFAESIFEGI